jgi:hypothetical protein
VGFQRIAEQGYDVFVAFSLVLLCPEPVSQSVASMTADQKV